VFGVGPSLKRIVLFTTRQEPASLEEPQGRTAGPALQRGPRQICRPGFTWGYRGGESKTHGEETARSADELPALNLEEARCIFSDCGKVSTAIPDWVKGAQMPAFGVCSSPAEKCSLSFDRPALGALFRRIEALDRHRAAGSDADVEIPFLKPFLEFFQSGVSCSRCKGLLAVGTQPTAGIAGNSDEYRRTVKLNRVLEAGYRLQSLGILPF